MSETMDLLECWGLPRYFSQYDYPNSELVQTQKDLIVKFGDNPSNLLVTGGRDAEILACAAMVRFTQVKGGDTPGDRCFAHGEEMNAILMDFDGAQVLLNRYSLAKILIIRDISELLFPNTRNYAFLDALLTKRYYNNQYTILTSEYRHSIWKKCPSIMGGCRYSWWLVDKDRKVNVAG